MVNHRLLILGCSKKKSKADGELPAYQRYDGPAFRLLRKYRRENPQIKDLDCYVLSARYGLISDEYKIPHYDENLTLERVEQLRPIVLTQMEKILNSGSYKTLFISLGAVYRSIIMDYERLLPPDLKVIEANGSIGNRLSQLKDWLGRNISLTTPLVAPSKKAISLRGISINHSQSEILDIAKQAKTSGTVSFDRIQTWYVEMEGMQISPKWLVSQLTGLPRNAFHSMEARRLLSQLGIEVKKYETK